MIDNTTMSWPCMFFNMGSVEINFKNVSLMSVGVCFVMGAVLRLT